MANGIWRNARFRDTQFPLAIYAALSLLLLFLSRTQAGLFDRMRAGMSDWSAPVLRSVQTPVSGVNRWFGDIDGLFTLYRDNLRLKSENARLRQWQGRALALEARLAREENLLHAMPQHKNYLALAHVIGHSGKPFLETLILDAGKANGARAGLAVMDGRGLIGRIFVAGRHTSWVVLTSDINSRIPVTVGAGREQAILAGDNSDTPVLEALRPRAKVKIGDQIVTSGDGGTVPAGIAVGLLVSQHGQRRAQLFADPATADDVEIMKASALPETLPSNAPQDAFMTAGMTPLPAPPQPQPQPANQTLAAHASRPDQTEKTAAAVVKAPPPAQSSAPATQPPPQQADESPE
jgi:rod shape-determining protein MreC